MSRKIKYGIEDIKKVHNLINNENMTKKEAIKKVGFSNSSVYHNALKRLNVKEEISLIEDVQQKTEKQELSFI